MKIEIVSILHVFGKWTASFNQSDAVDLPEVGEAVELLDEASRPVTRAIIDSVVPGNEKIANLALGNLDETQVRNAKFMRVVQ